MENLQEIGCQLSLQNLGQIFRKLRSQKIPCLDKGTLDNINQDMGTLDNINPDRGTLDNINQDRGTLDNINHDNI